MSNKKKYVHFNPLRTPSRNSVKAVQFRPIEINTEELELLIKTAHKKSKINDDTSMKHKDIVKLTKDFLKIVTKSTNSYGKQQYSLDIEVEEKAPRQEDQDSFWSKIVHFNQPKKIYKVIDATFDPKVFQNQLGDQSGHKKKIVSLRVKCLVLITENGTWSRTLSSLISPAGTQQSEDIIEVQEVSLKIQKVMIEWGEEVGGTRKRYRTRLSNNRDTSLIQNYETMCNKNYDIKTRDSFKVELIPTRCPKCGSQQMKPRKIINRTTSNYTNCSNCNLIMSKMETEPNYSKRDDLFAQTNRNQNINKNVSREKDRCLPMKNKTNGISGPGGTEGGDRISTLSADLIEVKQKIVKIIESIANHELL